MSVPFAAICAMSAESNCISPWAGNEGVIAQLVGTCPSEHQSRAVDERHAGFDQQIVYEAVGRAGEVRDVRGDDLFPARRRGIERGLIGRIAAVISDLLT